MQPIGTGADVRSLLQAAGLRVTRPRLAVLEVLDHEPHSTADQLARAVREQIGSVSTQAIYDVLHACTAVGLVRRIEPSGSPARFETRTNDNHHHMVCRSCGEVLDVDCAVGAAPCLSVAEGAGFAVHEAEIVFWGTCPSCQTAGITDPHPEHISVEEDRT